MHCVFSDIINTFQIKFDELLNSKSNKGNLFIFKTNSDTIISTEIYAKSDNKVFSYILNFNQIFLNTIWALRS